MKTPLEVRNDAVARALTLRWPAGETQRVKHARLRAACPCAACRRVRLDGAAPAAAADVMLIGIEPMGYGVQLAFSDGHARGIYPWTYLEQLGRGEDR
ncbi:gamma-butyrobetaine hydroxylase-like domain-containing protein [Paraburkholderia sp. BR14263]|uniref:Gamma-butyrobetaine hydroxylase-like domain-containing protein n=2 Tax=Paraburkholderia TaxID=1822464 RepID=A0ABU9S5Q8_9BURK